MRLGEILNKIFRKRESEELIKQNENPAENIYKPTEHKSEDDSKFGKIIKNITTEHGERSTTEIERIRKRNRFILVGASITVLVIIISLLSITFTRIVNSAFKEHKVTISINGPESVTVGQIVEYKILVSNKNRVDLDDVTIGLTLPENFELQKDAIVVDKNLSGARINVGTLKKGAKKQYKIKVNINYLNDSKLIFKAFVRYKPKNVSSFFQSSAIQNIKLERSGIVASISAVNEVSSGEILDLTVTIKNNGEQSYHNTFVKIDYPQGFDFINSAPSVSKEEDNNNIWEITNLPSNSQKEIKISGRLSGRVDAIKNFKVTVRQDKEGKIILSEGVSTIRVIPSKIILKQESNKKNIYPGEYVNYTVSFKNNSDTVLRNLILKTYLPGKFIRYDNMKHEKGYYNVDENLIIWKASEVEKLKELQPGEEGVVEFSVQSQDIILPEEDENKNPYLRVYSEIESLDVDSPVFENKKIVSEKTKTLINSMTQVLGTVKYLPEDNNGTIEESLQVGKKVYFRVILELKNTTNDLKNVKLTAAFPSGISWEKQIYPKGDNLEFNERSNILEWNMGHVKAGTGFTSPPEKAEFIIGIIPSVDQVGNSIDLINNMQVTGKDIFTKSAVEYDFQVIKSTIVQGLRNGNVIEAEEDETE